MKSKSIMYLIRWGKVDPLFGDKQGGKEEDMDSIVPTTRFKIDA